MSLSPAMPERSAAVPMVATAAPLQVLEVIGNAIVGGMESWVLSMLEQLPRERFLFTALCPFESRFTESVRALGVPVLIAPMPDDPPWTTIQMAASVVASHGIQLLHAHLAKAHLLAGLVGRLVDRPVFATVHGRQLGTLDLEVQRQMGSHLSVVCQPTYYQALGLGVSRERLSCEPNGVDTGRYAPRPRTAAGLRATLGLDASTPLVGFVGRLSPEKGPEVALRAALLLRTRCPGARLVLVGEGPMEADLRALAHRLGLADTVLFAGVRDDMPAVYNALDVLVSSSHSEAMPLALMEAMASGVPVVASRVGGVPDIVAHGETGWLVASGDFEDIAARTGQLLDSDTMRSAMGARARQRAAALFPLDQAMQRVGALMERLALPRGPVASAVTVPIRRNSAVNGRASALRSRER
jgi:glycosyltransferase involved in cell wall biosynthesis